MPTDTTVELVTIPPPEYSAGDWWIYVDSSGETQEMRILDVETVSDGLEVMQRLTVEDQGRIMTRVYRAEDGALSVWSEYEIREHVLALTYYDPPCPSFFGTRAIGSVWNQTCHWRWDIVDQGTARNAANVSFPESYELVGRSQWQTDQGNEPTWHIRVKRNNTGGPIEHSQGAVEIQYSERLCMKILSDEEPVYEIKQGFCAKGLRARQ